MAACSFSDSFCSGLTEMVHLEVGNGTAAPNPTADHETVQREPVIACRTVCRRWKSGKTNTLDSWFVQNAVTNTLGVT